MRDDADALDINIKQVERIKVALNADLKQTEIHFLVAVQERSECQLHGTRIRQRLFDIREIVHGEVIRREFKDPLIREHVATGLESVVTGQHNLKRICSFSEGVWTLACGLAVGWRQVGVEPPQPHGGALDRTAVAS